MKFERAMFKSVGNFLFPAVKAEFHSVYSLPESIARLRAATDRGNPFALQQSMQGEFHDTRIVLSRVIPFVSNPYAPVFTGHFQTDGERLVLRGQFRTKQGYIVYEYFGLVFLAFLGAITLPAAIINPKTAWWAPLVFFGILAATVGQIRLFQWFGRNHVAWLSHQIGRTLGRHEDWPDPPPKPPAWWQRKWRDAAAQ